MMSMTPFVEKGSKKETKTPTKSFLPDDDDEQDLFLEELPDELSRLDPFNKQQSDAFLDSNPPDNQDIVNIDEEKNDEDALTMGIRQREKLIDELKKENFDLKLRIYFLNENVQKLTPQGFQGIVEENADLKCEIQEVKYQLQQIQQEQVAKESELFQKLDDLEEQLEIKDEEILSLTERLDNSKEEFSQVKSRLTMEIEDLNQRLEQALQSASSSSSDKKSIPTIVTNDGSNSDMSQKLKFYKNQIFELQQIARSSSEEIQVLKQRLADQSLKLEQAESGKNISSTMIPNSRISQNSTTREIILETSNKLKPRPAYINELESILSEIPKYLSSHKSPVSNDFQDLVERIARLLPSEKMYEENRQRYIHELKERNVLLVRIKQKLDIFLGTSDHSQPIKSFKELKTYFEQILNGPHFINRRSSQSATEISQPSSIHSAKEPQMHHDAKIKELESLLLLERDGANRRLNEMIKEQKALKAQIAILKEKSKLTKKTIPSRPESRTQTPTKSNSDLLQLQSQYGKLVTQNERLKRSMEQRHDNIRMAMGMLQDLSTSRRDTSGRSEMLRKALQCLESALSNDPTADIPLA